MTKTIFIPAKAIVSIEPLIEKIKEQFKNRKTGLIAAVQFLDYLQELKRECSNAIIGGQILGCNINNALKIKNKVDCFIFVGSGEFHPLEVALKTSKPVYIANPVTNEIPQISTKEIEDIKKQRKGKLMKFIVAEKIGILVSTKPGQYKFKNAQELKKRFSKEFKLGEYKIKPKENYIFVFDTLRAEELENFSEIECWINTACPRIKMKNVIWIGELGENKILIAKHKSF